jgi:hypothetical protein
MELEHLHVWGALLRKYEGAEPEVLFPGPFVVDFKFTENKAYVRAVLDRQRDVRLVSGRDHGWMLRDQLPADWPSYRYQQIVNAGGVPSEEIVQRQANGHEGSPLGGNGSRPGAELLTRARELALSQGDGQRR